MKGVFGFVRAHMGYGEYAGKELEAIVGFVPQDTSVKIDGVIAESAAALEIDFILKRVVLKERMVVPKEQYEGMVRTGHVVKLLGEFVQPDGKGGQILNAVIERETVGALGYASFEASDMRIVYAPDKVPPASFVIFNYEPVASLQGLRIVADAGQPGDKWLRVFMELKPILAE